MFMNEETLTILDRYVAEQMEEEFIEKTQDELKVVLLVFVIPKREPGEWRVIVDLRYVNRY
jgi:hypothetical protein